MKNIKILFLLLIGIRAFGQISISLDEAYEKALQNNLDVKGAKLKVEFQNKIKNSGIEVEALNFSTEIGQIDTKDFDYNFSISQTFRLPNFYRRQKKLLLEEWNASLVEENLQKWKLKKDLSLIFSHLHYLDEKKRLLEKTDSIYTQYFSKADLRLRKGEAHLLEVSTAESLKSQINIQLFNIKKDKEVALRELNFIINDHQTYTNREEKFRLEKKIFGEVDLNQHWIVQRLEQQENIELARLNAEKTKLLPYFSLGYNNSAKRDLDSPIRLHSLTFGVSIPVFNVGQKSVIQGQKVNQIIAKNNKEIGIRDLKKQLSELIGEYEKLHSEVNYYEQKGLENSEKIIETASSQLYKGEINFFEWFVLVNQALEIQNQYIDRTKDLNDKIIEINALFIKS